MKIARRPLFAGLTASAIAWKARAAERKIFDCHFHVIDYRFPISANEGYKPPSFPLSDYLAAARPIGVRGGAVVSGSFQGFDQSYLASALSALGPGWVGVTQVPADVSDSEITRLNGLGVRGLRFTLYRGHVDSVGDLVALASRAHAVAGWHAEIYADAATLKPHIGELSKLPQISIDHLGMTQAGLPIVCELVAAGAKVKATGFGRVTFDVPAALQAIAAVREDALVFGTDIPSTRARRPFEVSDIDLIEQTLGAELAKRVFWDNGLALYRVTPPT